MLQVKTPSSQMHNKGSRIWLSQKSKNKKLDFPGLPLDIVDHVTQFCPIIYRFPKCHLESRCEAWNTVGTWLWGPLHKEQKGNTSRAVKQTARDNECPSWLKLSFYNLTSGHIMWGKETYFFLKLLVVFLSFGRHNSCMLCFLSFTFHTSNPVSFTTSQFNIALYLNANTSSSSYYYYLF